MDGIEILSDGAGLANATIPTPADGDDDGLTAEDDLEELLFRAVRTRRRGHPKAAMAALVDAANQLAHDHNIAGGAWL